MLRSYLNLNLAKGPLDKDHEKAEKDNKMDLNNLFITQIDKEKFYKQIKKFTLGVKDYEDPEKHAIMEYRLLQRR